MLTYNTGNRSQHRHSEVYGGIVSASTEHPNGRVRTDDAEIHASLRCLGVGQGEQVRRQVQLGAVSKKTGTGIRSSSTYNEHDDLVSSSHRECGQRRGDHKRHAIRKQRTHNAIQHEDHPLSRCVSGSVLIHVQMTYEEPKTAELVGGGGEDDDNERGNDHCKDRVEE